MQPSRSPVWPGAVGVLLALVLCSCSSSSKTTATPAATTGPATGAPSATAPSGAAPSGAAPSGAAGATASAPAGGPPGSATPGTSTGPAPSAGSGGTATRARCRSASLQLRVELGEGAAGSRFVPLLLTNTGRSACTMVGYPAVSLLDTSGRRLGPPARRQPGAVVRRVVLAPQRSASALLRLVNVRNYDAAACAPALASTLRVVPPGETTPLATAIEFPVCTTRIVTATVGPITPAVRAVS